MTKRVTYMTIRHVPSHVIGINIATNVANYHQFSSKTMLFLPIWGAFKDDFS